MYQQGSAVRWYPVTAAGLRLGTTDTGKPNRALGANVDPGGQLDMQQLLAAAQQMQSQLMTAQQELADTEVEGTAGGGLVKAVVNGQGELVDISIAAAAIDPEDPEESAQTIADLVLAAVRDAYRAAGDLQQEMMGPLAAGLGGAGGAGLPGFPGLPGLGGPGDPAGGLGDPAGGLGDPAGGQ
jgi:nucleoid-associated protein EbfC